MQNDATMVSSYHVNYLLLVLGCKDTAVLVLDAHPSVVVGTGLEKLLGLDVASELHLFQLIVGPFVHRYGANKAIGERRFDESKQRQVN